MAHRNHVHPDDLYYPLDNSAVFTASVSRPATPYLYRVSCDFDHNICLPDMEEALRTAAPRFPWLLTVLRPGMFWYYLDPLKMPMRLMADSRYPVEYRRPGRLAGRHLFRVRVFGSRLSCEFHHILTDGTGALEFLKTMLAVYLTHRGVSCPDWGSIIRPDTAVTPEEFEDSYARYDQPQYPEPARLETAYHLKGPRYRDREYRVMCAVMSVKAVHAVAAKHQVTMTELMASLYLYALQMVAEEESPRDLKPLTVLLPVNLRRMYPSRTLRNFFLYVPLTVERRLGHYSLEEILERVHCLMKLQLNKRELNRQIRRNVGGELHPISRGFPLLFKHFIIRIIGVFQADRPFSGSLSNMGPVSLPPEFAACIRRFDFVPARNDVTGASLAMISFQDVLTLTVGSRVVSRRLEQVLVEQCVSLGISVEIQSNM